MAGGGLNSPEKGWNGYRLLRVLRAENRRKQHAIVSCLAAMAVTIEKQEEKLTGIRKGQQRRRGRSNDGRRCENGRKQYPAAGKTEDVAVAASPECAA